MCLPRVSRILALGVLPSADPVYQAEATIRQPFEGAELEPSALFRGREQGMTLACNQRGVAECDPQPVEPAALGREIGDIQEDCARVAISLLLESISPPASDSSQCSSEGIGR